MNKEINPTAYEALENALTALHNHHNNDAYKLASQAAKLAPDWDAPLILLASLSDPETSIAYLKKALEINPASERARQGMHWAIKRYRNKISAGIDSDIQTGKGSNVIGFPGSHSSAKNFVNQQFISGKKSPKKWIFILPGLLLLCIVVLAALFIAPTGIAAIYQKPQGMYQEIVLVKPSLTSTYTPTATNTFTPTATSTATPTSTFTPTSTSTATATNTPKATKTLPEPLPTFTPGYESNSYYYEQNITDPPSNGRWIDVNLTYQQLYAYKGSELVNAFIVSTGIADYPTVTGRYSIYVKYLYDDMVGPGYDLKDVPYTMYFYKGYGIHGTYWHNNFGTPMSHGCINMRTSDAAWLYSWASIGTIVNVHY